MSQTHNAGSTLEFDVYDRLRKAMRIGGHTAGTLAVALGVHRNTINNLLSGRTPLDRRTLLSWAVACGVPPTWLESGEMPGEGGPDGGGQVLPSTLSRSYVTELRAVA